MQSIPLSRRECVPCKGGVPPLKREELSPLLAEIPDWSVVEIDTTRHGRVLTLERAYTFPDFKTAMAFAARVGDLAEEQQHHPDLFVSWGRVRVQIWTHKIGGLTESDAVFAAKCDATAR